MIFDSNNFIPSFFDLIWAIFEHNLKNLMNSQAKIFKCKTFVGILESNKDSFILFLLDFWSKLEIPHIPQVMHPFSEIQLIVVPLVFFKSRIVNFACYLFTEKHKKLAEVFYRHLGRIRIT